MLFLDTARMGRPGPLVRKTLAELGELWGQHGMSPAFDDFLQNGYPEPRGSRQSYPWSTLWKGAHELCDQFRLLAGLDSSWTSYIANRSTELITVAVQYLNSHSSRTLCLESAWSSYRQILYEHCDCVSINDEELSDDELVEFACSVFVATNCQSILLSAVTHLGRRIPYRRIIESILETSAIKLVIDPST